jgi:hypothetical protein
MMIDKNNKRQISPLLFRRRVRFAFIILASQLLLLALAVTFLIQLLFIAGNGSVQFIENKPVILFSEIGLVILVIIFSLFVFFFQVKRLGEKREIDTTERREVHSSDLPQKG